MIIYMLRNRINGKAYVGQTIQSIEYRWSQHKSDAGRGGRNYLHRAIRLYGADNFELATLATATTLAELNELEEYHIRAQGTLSPNGYNLKTGGDRWQFTQEVKDKISLAKKGKKRSPESIAKFVLARTGQKNSPEHIAKTAAWHRGRKRSPETRQKISLAMMGRKFGPFTDEHKAKISAARKGMVFSDETRAKMSLAKKGKKLSDEHRAKLSLARIGNTNKRDWLDKHKLNGSIN